MKISRILSLLTLILGEILLIVSFFLFRGEAKADIFYLNLIVGCILFALPFLSFIYGWVNMNDSSHKEIGSMGIRWTFSIWYMVLAVGVMIVGNCFFSFSFTVQLTLQIALLLFFILGNSLSFKATEKVEAVYNEQSQMKANKQKMVKAMSELQDTIALCKEPLPDKFRQDIDCLSEEIRYISPTNNYDEATQLEHQILSLITDIQLALSNYQMNESIIGDKIVRLRNNLDKRKKCYSK